MSYSQFLIHNSIYQYCARWIYVSITNSISADCVLCGYATYMKHINFDQDDQKNFLMGN